MEGKIISLKENIADSGLKGKYHANLLSFQFTGSLLRALLKLVYS